MIDESLMLLENMQHFHFLRPYWFLLFVAVYFIIRTFALRDDGLKQWRDVMSAEILQNLTVAGNNQHWLSPQRMTLVLAVPLCIVLMGPTWQQQPSPFSENNAPLIIALDVSHTMTQDDVQPSRLLRAKQKILALLDARGDSKTALIAFSGSAHIVMPITNDREMIRHFLDALEEKVMPVSGKLPEAVLPLVDNLLADSTVPGTLLLIGDGATQNTVKQFKQYFAKKTAQLLVWAIGKAESSLPDEQTNNDYIPMQLSQLEALTNESNGRLVLMTIDAKDVNRVNQYIKYNLVIVDDNSRPWHDSGYPVLFILAGLFLFWFRKGWTLQW